MLLLKGNLWSDGEWRMSTLLWSYICRCLQDDVRHRHQELPVRRTELPPAVRRVVLPDDEDEHVEHERDDQPRLVHAERRVADHEDDRGTRRVLLRGQWQGALRVRRLQHLPTPTSHVLRRQRHRAEHYDVSAAALHLLLYAGAEGSDRRRRPVVLSHLPAQRRRKHPEDFRSRAATRWGGGVVVVRGYCVSHIW